MVYDEKAKLWVDKKSGNVYDPESCLTSHPANFGKALQGAFDWASTRTQIPMRSGLGDYAPDRIDALNELAAEKYKVPFGIMERSAMDESGYGKNLISPAGALGVYQFMPETAKG